MYFSYPAYMSGDAIWTAVDGFSGATPLGLAAIGVSPDQFVDAYGQTITWMDAFWVICKAQSVKCQHLPS